MKTIKYTKVRNDFLERKDLTAAEKLILIYLHGRMTRDGQPWEVNREQIAGTLGIGVSAVRNALAKLRQDGWLTDNTKPVRTPRGIQRAKATPVESRRPEVIALVNVKVRNQPSQDIVKASPGHPEGGFPTNSLQPSNKEHTGINFYEDDDDVPPFMRDDFEDSPEVNGGAQAEPLTVHQTSPLQPVAEPVNDRKPVKLGDDWPTGDELAYGYDDSGEPSEPPTETLISGRYSSPRKNAEGRTGPYKPSWAD